MDDLHFVRREDQSLILANDENVEFRLPATEDLLAELRHLSRRAREVGKVRPREIQSMVRAGKTRAEIAEETGLDEEDIERYEEPVLAERRYMLERAHAVPVRTDTRTDEDEQFGAVIAERLVGLEADTIEWRSWRDEETGWIIALDFTARSVEHRALWSFDHRKHTLSPINPEAVNLSQQGEVGERLIPKLRAVDAANEESTDTPGSEHSGADAHPSTGEASSDPDAGDSGSGVSDDTSRADDASDARDVEAEYERKLEIDQRAIKTDTAPENTSFNETADLLDALRRRRGERTAASSSAASTVESQTDSGAESLADGEPGGFGRAAREDDDAEALNDADDTGTLPRLGTPSIWGAAGVAAEAETSSDETRERGDRPTRDESGSKSGSKSSSAEGQPERTGEPRPNGKSGRKGRASIPSWDDILFGTRSDEDPV